MVSEIVPIKGAEMLRRALDCLWQCAVEKRAEECLRDTLAVLGRSRYVTAEDEPMGAAA